MKGCIKTELYFLDEDFNVCGLTDSFASLILNRRFDRAGRFELDTAPETRYANLAAARYIHIPERGETAMIDGVVSGRENGAGFTRISGRMLEAILSSRVISEEETLAGRAEVIARLLVTKYAMTGVRAVGGLTLDTLIGYTASGELGALGENLMEKLYTFLNAASMSYSVKLDFSGRTAKFGVYAGLDRTTAQSVNGCAVFSESFGSLASYTLTNPVTDFYSYAYIDGADGNAELNLTADRERRELYIFASKLRKNGLSDAAYASLLRSYAAERIEAANGRLTLSAEINPNIAPYYKSGWDLGDICEVECPSAGISSPMRVTAVTETIKGGAATLHADFTEA